MLCVEGTQLKRLTVTPAGTITASVLGSGFMPGKHLAYDLVNNEAYLSNGVVTGKVTADGLVPWGVQTPARQPALAADTVGGLHAGTYQVAVTFVADTGEESGSPAPQEIAIAEGGGILLSLLRSPQRPTSTQSASTSVRRTRTCCITPARLRRAPAAHTSTGGTPGCRCRRCTWTRCHRQPRSPISGADLRRAGQCPILV